MGRKEEIGTELHPVGIGESPAMEQGGRREEREKKKKKISLMERHPFAKLYF